MFLLNLVEALIAILFQRSIWDFLMGLKMLEEKEDNFDSKIFGNSNT